MSTSTDAGQLSVVAFHNLVFHNLLLGRLAAIRPYPGNYRAGDPAVQVKATTVPTGSDHLQVCEEMFALLNVGDDPSFGVPDVRAVAYRRRGNRSLSISDLVQVDGTWYVCASMRFTAVEPPRVVTVAVAGASPYTGVDLAGFS